MRSMVFVVKGHSKQKEMFPSSFLMFLRVLFSIEKCGLPLSPFPSPSPRLVSRSACEPQRDREVS